MEAFVRKYQTPEHAPFRHPGSRGSVLFVHGFPGTPAEMRPLAQALHAQGWEVHGILLPGFGPQIDTLFQRTAREWIEAVRQALRQLKADSPGSPVIAVGFSMGAALVMQAAAEEKPDGVILLAPYWKLDSPFWNVLPVIRRVFPVIYPFRLFKLNPNHPDLRRGVGRILPDMNLDDPATQAALQKEMRQFALPTAIFDEVRRVGVMGAKAALRLTCPVLVIQGRQDPLVPMRTTRKLLQRLSGSLTYVEVDALHDLPIAEKPAWQQVSQAAVEFTSKLAPHSHYPHQNTPHAFTPLLQ
jgi:carboxylesterase